MKNLTGGYRRAKRGQMMAQLAGAPGFIMVLVVIGIVGAIGLTVLVNLGDSFTAGSAAANATGSAQEAIDDFFGLLPILGIVLIAVIILAAVGLLLAFTAFRR